jgi:hypothetical protein
MKRNKDGSKVERKASAKQTKHSPPFWHQGCDGVSKGGGGRGVPRPNGKRDRRGF